MDRISIHEDLMLGVLREALGDVPVGNIETRSVPLTEQELEKIIGKAPFVFVEYAGSTNTIRTEEGKTIACKYLYNIFTAAKSLRSLKDAQRGTYNILSSIKDALNGSIIADDTNPADVKRAGPFQFENESPMYDSPNGGTIYMSVYSVQEAIF